MPAKVNKRESPSYAISIKFPDGRLISKTKLYLSQLFNIYFINLDKNLKSKFYTLEDSENIYNKYKELYKDCKIIIQYSDSWGHIWKGDCAWPKKDKFIEYIKERIVNGS